MVELVLILMTFFIVKHFVVDFLQQPPYMYKNKGTYGHPGGLLHAGYHGLASFSFLVWVAPLSLVLFAIALEIIIHYHVDWFKMWYNAKKGWGANTHEEFWYLLGFDQLLHYLTYILMIAILLV